MLAAECDSLSTTVAPLIVHGDGGKNTMSSTPGCKPAFQTLPGTPGLALWEPLLPAIDADALLTELTATLPWQQPHITLYGRSHPVPRLQSWHGDADAGYRYSGLAMTPQPWTPALARLRDQVAAACGHHFNSVLANLYRDGRDSMGWHADDEPELGPQPWIASLSLGATRDFALRRKGAGRTALTLPLRHNQLLLMPPAMQQHWQHALPRRLRVEQPRLNLTFRLINRKTDR